jgi:hypothetical protein
LQLNDKEVFKYKLATNPKAAVHVGWLLSMAYLFKRIVPKINEHTRGTKNFNYGTRFQGGATPFY